LEVEAGVESQPGLHSKTLTQNNEEEEAHSFSFSTVRLAKF
jgi:hypothetical protein